MKLVFPRKKAQNKVLLHDLLPGEGVQNSQASFTKPVSGPLWGLFWRLWIVCVCVTRTIYVQLALTKIPERPPVVRRGFVTEKIRHGS